ncbi:hypothetical protein [Zhenpiania hominis]|uniref:Uncharacterized protein n=1 Tax=Zhenpiania hominis TaxID=2763644 RepID=A0A923NHT4_9FIRM|nr:hypothetical protein [Zhenpiania hominis]MBC6678337.1 hypothetical protein [Zhenpiania hominis]
MGEKISEQTRAEWMEEVLKLTYGRMKHLNEIFRLTREMASALDRNDRVSAQMLIEMRGEEMEAVASGLRKMHILEEQMPSELRDEIRRLLSGILDEQEDQDAVRLAEIARNCKSVLDQTIAIDQGMNKKVAGSDSYYAT